MEKQEIWVNVIMNGPVVFDSNPILPVKKDIVVIFSGNRLIISSLAATVKNLAWVKGIFYSVPFGPQQILTILIG